MKNVKYSIKFVKKKEHADLLYDGTLYMNAANYYAELERISGTRGIGDIREAAISYSKQIQKCPSLYIYCMFAVFDNNIIDNKIKISNEIIKNFECIKGYAVVIEYDKFEKALDKLDSKYSYCRGLVDYKTITEKDTIKFLTSNNNDHLFIKHPVFTPQQEYRIVVEENAKREKIEKIYDGINCVFLGEYKPKCFKIMEGLKEFTKIYSLETTIKDNEFTYLELK